MILEYVAQSAVADLRRFATPAALGSAVLSRGVEEHAGFSTQSARASTDAVAAAYRAVLACELVAAVRVLRMQGRAPAAAGRCGPPSTPRTRCSTRAPPTARWTPTSPPAEGLLRRVCRDISGAVTMAM